MNARVSRLAATLRHPVAQLAFRRHAGSGAFHVARSLTAIGTLVLLGATLGAQARISRELGTALFEDMTWILAAVVVLIVPALAVGPVARARETGMLDAITITGCPDAILARVFWASTASATVLVLVAAMPALVLTTTLGGVARGEVVVLLAFAVLGAASVSAIALACAIAHDPVPAVLLTWATIVATGPLAALSACLLGLVMGWTHVSPRAVGLFLAVGLAALTLWIARVAAARALASRRFEVNVPPSQAIRTSSYDYVAIDEPGSYLVACQDPALRIFGSTISGILLLWLIADLLGGRGGGTLPYAILLVTTAVATGSLEAARTAWALSSRERIWDLALAAQGGRALAGRILKSALASSRVTLPLAAIVTAGAGLAANVPGLAPRDLLHGLAGSASSLTLAGALFLLAAGGAASLLSGRPRRASPLLRGLLVIFAATLPELVFRRLPPGSMLRALHPMALLCWFLGDGPRPPVAAHADAAGWLAASLLVFALLLRRLHRVLRNPLG